MEVLEDVTALDGKGMKKEGHITCPLLRNTQGQSFLQAVENLYL
jgi:hypothetical protein